MNKVNYDHTLKNTLKACGCTIDEETVARVENVIDVLNEFDTQSEVIEFVFGNLADPAVRLFVIKTFIDGLRTQQVKKED